MLLGSGHLTTMQENGEVVVAQVIYSVAVVVIGGSVGRVGRRPESRSWVVGQWSRVIPSWTCVSVGEHTCQRR